MFTPLPMQRVTLYLVGDETPDAALALGRFGVFQPEYVDQDGPISEPFGAHYREVFTSASTRLQKIRTHLGLVVEAPKTVPPRRVPRDELDELNAWLGDLWRSCSQREERLRQLRDELHVVRQLYDALGAYEPLDIDLGLLQADFRFLHVRLGTVPSEGIVRLRDAVGLLGFPLEEFSRSGDLTHVLLVGLADRARDLDQVLAAASFAESHIPAEFGAHPSKVRQELERRQQALIAGQQAEETARAACRDELEDRLQTASAIVALASAYARMSEMLRKRGSLASVAGWVPKDRLDALEQALERDLGSRFVLETRDPLPNERPVVPSVVRHPSFLRPFEKLVRTYGIPRYGEVDPTMLFALSFIAMFGMMFGDVGHGFVIAGAGFLARRKLSGFASFVIAIGAASILFGFLYGSVFGYEELIHPLWVAPLSDPALMLRLALYWGIAFILTMTAITIRNHLREGAVGEALLAGNGLTGAVFYFGLIYAAASWLDSGVFHNAAIAAVVLPLSVILIYEWRRVRAPLSEKAIVVFVEGFETLLGYVANTLSFLRVAAFSLNHVALATAVFTIANMLGPAGHWLVVVLGNLFILVLEGAIVTIQVLRLEYYEGFSRFFTGDGREFRPLTFGEIAVRRSDGR